MFFYQGRTAAAWRPLWESHGAALSVGNTFLESVLAQVGRLCILILLLLAFRTHIREFDRIFEDPFEETDSSSLLMQ